MSTSPESRLRTLLAVALSATLVGIGLSASDHADLGSWITIAGLILMIYGLHRFGRTGPDEPLEPTSDHEPEPDPQR